MLTFLLITVTFTSACYATDGTTFECLMGQTCCEGSHGNRNQCCPDGWTCELQYDDKGSFVTRTCLPPPNQIACLHLEHVGNADYLPSDMWYACDEDAECCTDIDHPDELCCAAGTTCTQGPDRYSPMVCQGPSDDDHSFNDDSPPQQDDDSPPQQDDDSTPQQDDSTPQQDDDDHSNFKLILLIVGLICGGILMCVCCYFARTYNSVQNSEPYQPLPATASA